MVRRWPGGASALPARAAAVVGGSSAGIFPSTSAATSRLRAGGAVRALHQRPAGCRGRALVRVSVLGTRRAAGRSRCSRTCTRACSDTRACTRTERYRKICIYRYVYTYRYIKIYFFFASDRVDAYVTKRVGVESPAIDAPTPARCIFFAPDGVDAYGRRRAGAGGPAPGGGRNFFIS